MHCMSDDYLVQELADEQAEKEELKANGFNIEKNQIKLQDSLASLGFHKVEIELHKEVNAIIKVHLVK